MLGIIHTFYSSVVRKMLRSVLLPLRSVLIVLTTGGNLGRGMSRGTLSDFTKRW